MTHVQDTLFDHPTREPETARTLREEGISRQESSPRLETFRGRIAQAIDTLASRPGEFTSDDVYLQAERQGDPFPPGMPMGACFNAAAKAGIIVRVWCPARKSERALSHGRAVTVWKGAR